VGDGDGFIERGEEADVDIRVANRGASIESEDLVLAFAPVLDVVTVPSPLLSIGNLEHGGEISFPAAFRLRIKMDAPVIPPILTFRTIFACGDCEPVVREDSVLVGIGSPVPLAEDFSSEPAAWRHMSLTTGADLWHFTTARSRSSPGAYAMGYEDGRPYSTRLDAVLVSPSFLVPPGGRLTFWQILDTESLSTGRAWDGGVVEVSDQGGAWRTLAPAGGYPFQLEGLGGNSRFGRPAFSGKSAAWSRAAFDLSPQSGHVIQIRFRFTSDASTGNVGQQSQTGWWIDDVGVEWGFPAASVEVVLVDDQVNVSWSVGAPAGAVPEVLAYEVRRRAEIEGSRRELVARAPAFPLPGRGSVLDQPPPGRFVYSVRAIEADGSGLEFEALPVDIVDRSDMPRLMAPYPSPFRPTGPPLTVEYFVPGPAREVEIEIFDVMGRRVVGLAHGSAELGPGRAQWTGETSRTRVRGGIYFAVLKIPGFAPVTQRFVVIP
jgi:hypothetical protein